MINLIMVLVVWLGLSVLICFLWYLIKKSEPKLFDEYGENDEAYRTMRHYLYHNNKWRNKQ